jgi:shikimate dehydrogenase
MPERQVELGSHTGMLALFGHPIRHSLSPRIHNAALQVHGLDLVYLAFDVRPEELPAAISGIRALGIRGANLTVPHKEAALALLDEVDPLAARVGAVNTVVNGDGQLMGYNTDIFGFSAALRTVMPEGAKGRDCLVIGAGGAARAVVAALVEDGAATVYVNNRSYERAAALCTAAASWGATKCLPSRAEALREVAFSAALIVNATPLGLEGSVKHLPLPVDTVHSGHVVVDLAYGLGPTVLVQASRSRGAAAVDGREMLVMQAALAYRLWTGLEAPIQAMRDSIERGER